MSTLNIPTDLLQRTGLSEQELLTELACRLFDIQKLSLKEAADLAGLDRVGMEDALLSRKIPIYRPTVEDLREDMETLERWRK